MWASANIDMRNYADFNAINGSGFYLYKCNNDRICPNVEGTGHAA
jgi:hypothetical protein